MIETGAPDPSSPEAIDDIAMIGIATEDPTCITFVILSGNPNTPLYVSRDISVEQAKKIQLALGRKIRAIRE